MEALLLVCVIVVLLVRWIYLRDRLNGMDERIDTLARLAAREPVPLAPLPASPPPRSEPRPEVIRPAPAPSPSPMPAAPPPRSEPRPLPAPSPSPVPTAPPAPAPRRSTDDWEALVGGNWLNKAGVFVLVIGIALALGYSFTRVGPAGRVAISIAMSLAMLVAGAVLEPRGRYRTFARGLLGGGWAALYFTVYAMQSLDAARVIHDPWLGAFLLLLVAVGMILHSLRYRSETVAGLAYFLAFVTLAISQVSSLAVLALVPLAASLLYVAHRFAWRTFAVLGLVATYATCALRGDTGAPLWQVQAIFTVFWILFEGFDILRPHRALLPLNAIGFLGLSLAKWNQAAPGRIWMLLAGAAIGYLAGTVLRWRSGRWHAAATLTAALLAVAIFLRLDHQWVALALLVEAELFHLAGVRWRAGYLRCLAGMLFVIQLGHLLAMDAGQIPVRAWTPIAALEAAVFYVNRALGASGAVYGYAAAAMLALVAGYEIDTPHLGRAWYLLAAATFFAGWWRRLPDFRYQGYGLAVLAAVATAIYAPHPPLALVAGAAAGYAAALCALWSAEDRFLEGERDALLFAASLSFAGMLAALVARLVPDQYLGLGWMALAVPLLELGMRGLPADLRRQSYILAVLGAVLVVARNLAELQNTGPLPPRLIPLGAALAAYAIAARARNQEGSRVLKVASFTGTGLMLVALWALLPPLAVGPAWAAVALALAEFDVPVLRLEAALVTCAAFGRLCFVNFDGPERIWTVTPVLICHYYLWWRTRQRLYLYTAAILAAALVRFQMGPLTVAAGWALLALALLCAGLRWTLEDLRWQSYALAALAFTACSYGAATVPIGAIVAACFFASQLLAARGSRPRLYYSLLATVLTALLLYYKVSGSLLTVAWGIEGVALLSSGFPLRDRVLRVSGLALLSFCILKLFLWDLRHLETMPRILSFIVLGLILVGVSWIYTRFRERVARYL